MKITRNNVNLPPFCPACEAENDCWRRGEETVEQIFRGETFHVVAETTKCVHCGFPIVGDADADRLVVATWNAYRSKHNLLFPDEIKERRKRVKMSQEEFAKFLGVGVASVKRWEGGLVQDKSSDNLIRAKTDEVLAGAIWNELVCYIARTPEALADLEALRDTLRHGLEAIEWQSPARALVISAIAPHEPFHAAGKKEWQVHIGSNCLALGTDDLPDWPVRYKKSCSFRAERIKIGHNASRGDFYAFANTTEALCLH
jgi:putative zinc finger/helix-turn-helix YgiT family protein